MQQITVKIENAYEDGHQSERYVTVDAPDDFERTTGLDTFFEEAVYPHTGDGHGVDGMGSYYKATIVTAHNNDLLGRYYEWID